MGEVIGQAMDARADEIRTAMPARVISYSLTAQTAEVQLTVWPGGEEPPVIPSVPVIWPRGGASYLVMPLAADDTGLIICCEADLAEWRRTGEAAAPADLARHHLQNAVFIPGLAVASDTVVQYANTTILSGDDVRLGDANAAFRVVHETGLSALDSISTDLTTIGTTLSAFATAIDVIHGPGMPTVAPLVAACTALGASTVAFTAGVAAGTYRSPSVKVDT